MKKNHSTHAFDNSKALNKSGLKSLHDQFFQKLYSYAKGFVHSAEIAEEIVLDVFLKIWERRNELQAVENMEAYLCTMTKNFSLNYLNSSKHKFMSQFKPLPDQPSLSLSFNPEETFKRHELQEALNRAIAQLPPQCAKVFQLVKEDGMKYKEVATIMNISVNTVDAHLARAIKVLRQELLEHAPKKKKAANQMVMARSFLFF